METIASVLWALILMIGVLPRLANHLFAQSSSEITQSSKQPKAPCIYFVFTILTALE